ncbi:sugar transferase [Mariniplasma anaerobium]|uniref:UDP-galactose phosphate transferase n=1 Tax=Mariniplasma anaerobium TaxID=2735436 RepID=A0A7U9TK65_9MOLU|nr:sugar transferase [Mariniplasma anaerobium]BCR36100.1 UDP-galactose phosphate transferase [Mariniplasma anaerobium]
MRRKRIYEKYFKRFFDFIVSLIAFVLLLPLLFIIAILIRIKLGSPIIFKQKRPGLNEKIFTLYKFRTMIDKRDEHGVLLPDSERLTNFGRFLRSTSIDELPGLLNIIRGDMSIVGPRPLLVEYLKYYTNEQSKRHSVRPGLTGYAQISGRNAISWEDKFDYDLQYVKSINLYNDIKIIIITIKKVFKREGISSKDNTTMEKFKGYKD